MKLAFLALVVALTGCAGSFEEAQVAGRDVKLGAAPPPTQECRDLDGARRTWSIIAAGSGALAGGSGIAQIPDDSKELRLGLAVGTVVTGALAYAAIKASDSFGESWARECSQ